MGEAIEMVFYTIFCRYDRFMEGEYSKQQKKINGNSNETYDFVVESLFGQHKQSGSGVSPNTVCWRSEPPALDRPTFPD
jgi:hypothetical protein